MSALKFFRRLHLSLPKIKYAIEGTAATLRKRQVTTTLQDSHQSSHTLSIQIIHKVLCTNKEFFLVSS